MVAEVTVELLVFQIGVTLLLCMLLGSIFGKFKQSPIVGYLLGGILLGPYVLGFIQQTDTLVLTLFSELGILMLLFFIGMELDIKKFKLGGFIAFVLGPAKIAICFGLGFLAGMVLGFTSTESILLGLIISFTSTAILAKYFMDNKMMNKLEARISIPMLLIEDFVAVIALALLSTYGAEGAINTIVLNSIFFIVVSIFVISWFSRYLIKFIERFEYERHITLYALGIALSLAYLASFFHLSPAIGAFLGGFLLAKLKHVEKIKIELETFRDFFAAFFFIGIGLQFVPTSINVVFMGLFVLFLYIIGQIISYGFFGVLIGLKGKFSVYLAGVKMPIGEFSLIIAGLAITLGTPHASDILGITIFLVITTTFLMTYMIQFSPNITNFIKFLTPKPLVRKFEFVSKKTTAVFQSSLTNKKVQNKLTLHFRKIGIGIFSVIGIAYLLFYTYLEIKLQLIAGIPNFALLFLLGAVLSIPSIFSIIKEIRQMLIDLVEMSSPEAFPKYSAEQIRIIEESISEIFLSFFLFIGAAIALLFGFVLNFLFYIPAIAFALLAIIILAFGWRDIRIERKYTEARIKKKRLVRGGKL